MSDELPEYKLRIGELFPADNLVGQWIFTLNAVTDDIAVLTEPLKIARERHDLRGTMSYTRLLVARLYEARRLVWAFRRYDEIRAFCNNKIPTPFGIDLLALYERTPEGDPGPIDRLYADTRHRSVHYPWVGKRELRELLYQHQRYPARMVIHNFAGHPDIEYQWVTAVRSIDMFGDPAAADVLAGLDERSKIMADAVAGWLFASSVLTLVYANKRGVDAERLVDDPEEFKAVIEQHKLDRESKPTE